MLDVKCIASGSTGNCYLVNLDGSLILLDCGIPKNRIVSKVNLNDIDFCFISHTHNDHSRALQDLNKFGVLTLEGKTIREFIKILKFKEFEPKYQVFCFPIKHDVPNSGLILRNSNECLLYATDFSECQYNLKQFKFTKVIVECNYLEDAVVNCETKRDITRQIKFHMGLNGVVNFLNTLDLSKCNEIILCHMSQNFGDSILMTSKVYSTFKIKTSICKQFGGVETIGG